MRLDWKDPLLRRVVAVVVAVLAGFGVTVAIVDNDGDSKPDVITVTVNQAPGDSQPAREVEVPASAVDAARDGFTHDDLRVAEDSPVPTDGQIERSARVQTRVEPLPEAGAVQGFAGCVTRILPANYSSRNGARATWQVLHYTVSPNRPGWSDVNAIVALFSNPGRQASSNFVIDAEGNCAYIVPIEAKAWTQAAGNPWSISYEIVATGSERAYLEPAGVAKLRSVARQVARRTGIPLSRGAVSGSCTPVRAGIVQHKDFGLCGGGHVDITPFSIDAAVVALSGPVGPVLPLTKAERKIQAGSCKPKGTGHTGRYWRRRARAHVAAFARAHGAGKSWRYHKIGARRKLLARAAAGRCGKRG